jgi:hypothetical protein
LPYAKTEVGYRGIWHLIFCFVLSVVIFISYAIPRVQKQWLSAKANGS